MRGPLKGMTFEIITPITGVVVIASGSGVRIRQHLNRSYGTGRWRKMKGFATVRLDDGTICDAEIHWFEAHGIGRRDLKIKQLIP
jgi:hypothetical protein